MSWFQSRNARDAARNDVIFNEEQRPLLDLQRTVDEFKRVAEAALARGDDVGADLFQKEADDLAVRLQALSSHCSRRAFERVNESTVNVFKIDLHAQLPTQAIQVVHETMLDMRSRTSSYVVKTEVHIVTGAGNHSVNGVSTVKQAVEEYLKWQRVPLGASNNAGMLIVPVSSTFPKLRVLDNKTCPTAADAGCIWVLKWARSNNASWGRLGTCRSAALKDHLDVLKWARANGAPWDGLVCQMFLHSGNLEALKWARANGIPWDAEFCSCGAYIVGITGGDKRQKVLDMLEWARANGAP